SPNIPKDAPPGLSDTMSPAGVLARRKKLPPFLNDAHGAARARPSMARPKSSFHVKPVGAASVLALTIVIESTTTAVARLEPASASTITVLMPAGFPNETAWDVPCRK